MSSQSAVMILAVFTWPCDTLGAVQAQKKVGPKTYSLEYSVSTCLRVCFVLLTGLARKLKAAEMVGFLSAHET